LLCISPNLVQKHPKAKKFKSKGFDLFDEISTFMRGSQKGGHVYHPGTSANRSDAAALTDSSPETVTANLDKDDVEHVNGILHVPNESVDGDQDMVPLSDAPLPPSSPPPGSHGGSSSRNKGKRKRSALDVPSASLESLESSPAVSSFSTPVSSDMGGKRARVTGPIVLSSIKEEMTSFRSVYTANSQAKLDIMKNLASKKTGADYRREAREMFQRLGFDMSDQAFFHILRVLQEDRNAETFVDLTADERRRAWVADQLGLQGLQ
jgi:hypothetical protein